MKRYISKGLFVLAVAPTLMFCCAGAGQNVDKETAGNDTQAEQQELIVKFKSDVNQAQRTALETRIGLEKVKDISTLNMTVYRVTSEKSVEAAVRACEQEPYVEYAEPNREYKTQNR